MINFSSLSCHSVAGRAVRLPLKLLPPSLVVPVLQGPLRGTRWIVGSSNHGCWLGSYEMDKQKRLASYLQSGDVVYDIGANVGLYTLLASRLVLARGHVFAFEPLPRNAELLRRHISLNRINNVTVIEAAVSDREGEARFDLGRNHFMGTLQAAGTLPVRLVCLDTLLQTGRLLKPSLLKLDVEGAEADVLMGARRILSDHRPIVFVATHGPDPHRRSIKILSSFGYNIMSLNRRSIDETDELLALPEYPARTPSLQCREHAYRPAVQEAHTRANLTSEFQPR